MHPAAPAIRKAMLEFCHTERRLGVFLSSGVDSNAVLSAFLLNGYKPVVVSFCLDGKPSTDFRSAQTTAKLEGLEFVPVFLNTDLDALVDDIRHLIWHFDLERKTEIETFWACSTAIKEAHDAGIEVVANGLGAGALFGDGRKGAIHAREDGDNPAWLDEERATKFTNPRYAQFAAWEQALGELGMSQVNPYREASMREALRGYSYNSCNKPVQKAPLRDAFPEMLRYKIKPHTNLQLGDSGIAELFEGLLKHPINKNGSKSVVGIYNALAKEIA